MLFVITLFFAGLSGLASSSGDAWLSIVFGVIAFLTMLADIITDMSGNDDKRL